MEENKHQAQTPQHTYPQVDEPTRTFKVFSDRIRLEVASEENRETLIEISGYDLRIDFNFKYLGSVEEIESAVDGIKELFRQAIMEQLLAKQ